MGAATSTSATELEASCRTIPDSAYTGQSLAAAIQQTTGRTTTYSALTNSITHELADASQPWLSDKDVEAHTGGGFPYGADQLLHAGGLALGAHVALLLRSSRLRCVDHHGPRGTHDILCDIPLTGGPGHQVEAFTPDGVYYDLQGELSIRSFDIRLWSGPK